MSNLAVRLLTARWIFPVTSPPLADGAVAIQGRQIVGVGPRADLAAVAISLSLSLSEAWFHA